MTTQLKHVSVNLAAHEAARWLHVAGDLSPAATVLLFRSMVLGESINPKSDIGRELVAADILQPFGQLKGWITEHLGEHIELLVREAGADLTPMHQPTSISQLGHAPISRSAGSRRSRDVLAAERIMINTGFRINRHVLRLAHRNEADLSKEERMALYIATRPDVQGHDLYFPVSYDYRGRMYYRGGLLSPQGPDLHKGLIEFAEGAPLGEHGYKALCYALADAMGYKGLRKDTELWLVMQDVEAVRDGSEGYLAAALANEWLLCYHLPTEAQQLFVSHVVCHQDATCSGLQIAAAATGHRPTADATNCTARPLDVPRGDVYQAVADALAQSNTPLGDLAARLGRALVKKAVMTLGYGAGKATLIRSLAEYLYDIGEYRGDPADFELDRASHKAFFDALEAHCGATVALLRTLQEAAEATPDDLQWTTADGFHVVQHKESGEEATAGRFKMTFSKELDSDLQATAIAPNVVHSIDAAQMRIAVRQLDRPVACVHDSLGTRACDYRDAAVAVRRAFIGCDPRGTVDRFLTDRGITTPTLGDYRPTEVMQSAYFWC